MNTLTESGNLELSSAAPWRLNTPGLCWPDQATVHIFEADLDAFRHCLPFLPLSDGERHRAKRYRLPEIAERFLIRRGILRHILAAYAHTNPKDIDLEVSGKPKWLNPPICRHLELTVSCSEARALYATASACRIGIDIEKMADPIDYLGVARQFFTPQEIACIEQQPVLHQKDAFYTCWTRKEAFMKAAGIRNLNSFETGGYGNAVADISDPENGASWHLLELPLGKDWKACLAIESGAQNPAASIQIHQVLP